jgi:signal peptidase I
VTDLSESAANTDLPGEVKRVIGIGGDRIEVQGRRVTVNRGSSTAPVHGRTLIVPRNHFFVIGANLGHSCDSRDFGVVDANEIRGRVVAVYRRPWDIRLM